MSLLVESIRIEEGRPLLLDYHNKRLNYSRASLFGVTDLIDLHDYIPTDLQDEKVLKWRVVYGKTIELNEVAPYHQKTVFTLKIVDAGAICYDYKYLLRPELDRLFDQKGIAEEVIMINSKGLVTDAYYYSLVFEKNRQYYTPSSYLLPSVMRSYLMDKSILEVRTISAIDIDYYERIHLINALNPLGSQCLEINSNTILR
jgi:4-amino-4-deoxychorismate lyase